MKRKTWLSTASLSILASLGALASCATNSDEDSAVEDSGTSIPEATAPSLEAATPDAEDASDAGCEAGDPRCTAVLEPCSVVSWCMVSTPANPFHALTSVWGASRNDVWAVGVGGTILHWGGAEWVSVPTDYKEVFYKVWGSAANDVWVVSHTGLVLHGDGFVSGAADGGVVWKNMAPAFMANGEVPTGKPIRAAWGTSGEDLRLATYPFYTYAYSSNEEFYFGGNANQLVKTKSDGDYVFEWRALPGSEHFITSIWGSAADDVWMTVDSGDDGTPGLTLHGKAGPRPNPRIDESYDCMGCEPECVSCAVADDLLWQPVDSQSKGTLEAVWGSSKDDVWAVGYRGAIRHIGVSDDEWQVVPSPTTENLHGLWGSGPNDIWMIGDSGTVLHWDGTTVTASSVQLPLGPKADLHGIWGTAKDDVWIVGDGVTLHFTGPKATEATK